MNRPADGHGVKQVQFARLPISLPCPVKVLPGTPTTMRDGVPIPIEERTEYCAVDAFWMIGGQIACDIHIREACEILGIDYDDLLAEAGGEHSGESQPWDQRRRYRQEDIRHAD